MKHALFSLQMCRLQLRMKRLCFLLWVVCPAQSRASASLIEYNWGSIRRWKSVQRHGTLSEEGLRSEQENMTSLLQNDGERLAAAGEDLVVMVPANLDATFSACWNPRVTPTSNLRDFTLEVGKVTSYGTAPSRPLLFVVHAINAIKRTLFLFVLGASPF